jgi:hypothetical protein
MQFSLAFNYLNVLMHSTDRQAYPQPAFSYSVGAAMKLSLVDWYLPMGTGVIYVMCKVRGTGRGWRGRRATEGRCFGWAGLPPSLWSNSKPAVPIPSCPLRSSTCLSASCG